MSETTVAHFRMRWQAEFAQGFLEDAGVPSRIVADQAAGGPMYMGELAGASLLVAEREAADARTVLESAGVLEPDASPGGESGALREGLTPVERADLDDLTERLRAVRKEELKHGAYALLGFTPAALIPLVGLALEGSVGLMVLLCVLVVFVEGYRWIRAGREAEWLDTAIRELKEGTPAA